VPAATVLLAVGIAVALAAHARGGPRRETALTETEVPLSWTRQDDTALWATLAWMMPERETMTPGGWVGMARLAALGLDTSLATRGGRDKSVPAFAVLEYDGPAFAAFVAERVAARRATLGDTTAAVRDSILAAERATHERGTRLVLLDVDRDAATLAARYPDASRHLILRATVGTSVQYGPFTPAQPARHDSVLGSHVMIERTRMLVSGAGVAAFRGAGRPTRYAVTVATGRGWVPWVMGMRPR
jgi:hypothetical protein